MKHACETLQHIVIFHVCLVYEMNSVQHSSATYATHFSETWLVVLCNMSQNRPIYKSTSTKTIAETIILALEPI